MCDYSFRQATQNSSGSHFTLPPSFISPYLSLSLLTVSIYLHTQSNILNWSGPELWLLFHTDRPLGMTSCEGVGANSKHIGMLKQDTCTHTHILTDTCKIPLVHICGKQQRVGHSGILGQMHTVKVSFSSFPSFSLPITVQHFLFPFVFLSLWLSFSPF